MSRFFVSVSVFSLLFSGASYAAEELKPRFETNMRPGTERSILMGEYWIPLAQDEDSVIYGDLRFMGDDNQAREFNAGLGYRDIVDSDILGRGVVGVHGWFDRRKTPNENMFSQVTGGVEWFGDTFDIKSNMYVPLSGDQDFTKANPNGTNGRLVGNQIVVNTDQQLVEEALIGLDFELGWKLDFADSFTDSTRVYGGAYHFEGDRADDVSGWRTRISSDITEDIQLGMRFQRDDVRGSQGFLEATFRFPFGSKKSYQKEGVRARLDESPERDIDIVSNSAVTDDGNNKVLVNDGTGATQNIIVVDSNAGIDGAGTAESPYNLLSSAEAAAGDNDLIYVIGGGATLNGGITLNNPGQKLIGSGADLTLEDLGVSASNGEGFTASGGVVLPKTTAPVITNAGGFGLQVISDNITISGLTLDSTNTAGVTVTDANNLTLKNLTIENAGANGITANYNDGDSHVVHIKNNTITDSNGLGIALFSRNGTHLTSYVDDNYVHTTGSNGIAFSGFHTSTNETYLRGNSVFDVHGVALRYSLTNDSSGSVVMSDNHSDTTTLYFNALVRATGDAQVDSAKILNNTFLNSISSGLVIDLYSGVTSSISNLEVSGNTIDNGGNGLNILGSAGNGSIHGIVENNVIKNARDRGFRIEAFDDTSLEISVSENQVYDSANHNVRIIDNSTGTINADFGGGTLSSMGLNQIYGAGGTDMRVDLDGGTLKAENNFWGSSLGLQNSQIEPGSNPIDADPFLTEAP